MAGLLLIALAMVNVPVYLLVGRKFFGTWDRFVETIRLWGSMESLTDPWSATGEASTADTQLGMFLACSAGAVLTEFLLLSHFMTGGLF